MNGEVERMSAACEQERERFQRALYTLLTSAAKQETESEAEAESVQQETVANARQLFDEYRSNIALITTCDEQMQYPS